LAQLKELDKHAFVDPYELGIIYAGLGDRDQAFAALDRAFSHPTNGAFLKSDPFWNTMSSDPRYAALLRRMGLPQ
jgi:hypothetical protein